MPPRTGNAPHHRLMLLLTPSERHSRLHPLVLILIMSAWGTGKDAVKVNTFSWL
jgi:hypothetical protein